MKAKSFRRILAMALALVLVVSLFSVYVSAAWNYQESITNDNYYKLISQRYWQLAPGVQETEVVLNNDSGTRRQVVHSVSVDLDNPYNDVIPGYKGMNEGIQAKKFGIETTSVQAKNAEKLGYGNVVAATNAMLSWYTSAYYQQHPEYVGQPLGWNMCNGYYYENSQGRLGDMAASYAVLVINYDEHPITGEPRPDSIPKVQMRGINDPMTGWEKNAISAWAWLVKPDANGNPVNQYAAINHTSDIASRTFMGVKADGTFVVSVSDGEQLPYSAGFTPHEMADYMIKMGCIYACNCDGGGSTTFCTQRPGEELKVNCSLSDGGERPTTNTILIISNAPADGELAQATISSEYDYYTPGSTVAFDAIGTDVSSAVVDIPDDVQWQIKEAGMGTIENGVFVSNGTEGTVTAQMVYNNIVVGEKVITIDTPEAISLNQPVVTVPYGKTQVIPIKATVNNGLNEIGLGPNDISFVTDNAALGAFDGMYFTAVDEDAAPETITSNVTATLNMGTNPTLNFELKLGKGSDVLFDFEGGQADVDIWNIIDNRKGTVWDYDMSLSLADATNGQVHDGQYSLRMELNGLSSNLSHSSEYGWIRIGVDGDAIELENAKSLGFWMYIPDECIQLWAQGNYMADSDGNGTYDTQCLVSMPPAFPNQVYESVDEPGWYYLEMDLSEYQNVALKDTRTFPKADGTQGEFFISFIFARAKNNPILDGVTAIGPYTFYLDNFTVDYSDAVEDRENPEIEKIYMDGVGMEKREVVTTTSSTVSFTSNVADATERIDANKVAHPLYNTSGINASTAKAYIDGVQVDASYANGVMSTGDITLADGYHRVKFEICDNAGNKDVMIRVFKVEAGSDASTVKFVPADETLDRLLFGSVYWMNLVATDMEKIQSVETVIDMNMVNHWELDHMVLAEGFTAEYYLDEETNTAAITFTRTGANDQTGEAVIAQIPARILDYDNDIHVPGKTAAQYWATHEFWGHDLAFDVDYGLITYTDDTTSTFSNEEFRIQTEMYTSRNYMDAAYLTTHGSTHIHNAQPIEDKAPSCTEEGYSARTFCAECNSVVDWGITIPRADHSYVISAGYLFCTECGKKYTGYGMINVDGKNYFTVAGKLTGGWQQVDDEWYYFNPKNYAGLDGYQVADKGIAFEFDNGRLVHGSWQELSDGNVRYWYGPTYVKDTAPTSTSSIPYEIDGYTYLFDHWGNMKRDCICHFFDGTYEPDWYIVDADGHAKLFNGVYNNRFYDENGEQVVTYKLCELNGDYYYVGEGHLITRSKTVYLNKVLEGYCYPGTDIQMTPGNYEFDADGKMVFKNGLIDGYYYENGVKVTDYRLIEIDGDYYYIGEGHKITTGKTVYLNKVLAGFTYPGTDIQMTPGNYEFDADGKMVFKNGLIDGSFYQNGLLVKAYTLVEYQGDFYYVSDGNKIAKNVTLYLNKVLAGYTYPGTNDPMVAGNYEFDADGKMVFKNGPIDGYFYVNGIKQRAYQLFQYEGDFYYVSDGNKIATNSTQYLNKVLAGYTYPGTDIAMQAGNYDFGADGKMVFRNGPVDGYYYVYGIKQKAYQLFEYNGDFYYVSDGNKIAKNTTLYLNKVLAGFTYPGTDIAMQSGNYDFDADGKMQFKNGPVGDYYYVNGEKQKAYKLFEFNGNFYYVSDGNKIVKNKSVYLNKVLEGFTYNGQPLQKGNYYFNAEGKMVIG